MKKFLIAIFCLCSLVGVAQPYGNQTAVTLNRGNGYTFPALVHDVSNKTIKHPVFISVPGKGHNSTDLNTITNAGSALYLKNGWNGTAINPVTTVTEEFIIINTLPGDYKLSDNNWDSFLKWLYYTSPYKDYIDTNRVTASGFSAGCPGFSFYAMHKDLIPSHKLNWIMPFSPEMNCCDAMDKLVSDSVRVFGAGVVPDDSHADQVQNEIIRANQFKANYAVFRANPYNPCPTQSGHCNPAWNYWYNPETDTTYFDNNYNFGTGNQINIYQIALLYSQSPAVVPTQTITLGTVTASPYCVTAVSGKAISVTYTTSGTFGGGNQFRVELSSPSGSFASPVVIGTGSSPITATVPANTLGSTTYKVRVSSTIPKVVSSASTSLSVILAKNSISPTGTQNLSVSANGNTLTVTNGSTPNSIQWYDGVNPIEGAIGSTFTPNFPDAGTHTVTAHSTYTSCEITAISNAVTINVSNVISSKRHYLTKGGDNGIFLNACNGYQYNPGDTFVLRASLNPYSYVTFYCFNNITVINEGGQGLLQNFGSIPGGFEFRNCTNIHLTGTGTATDQYGFKVSTDAYRGVGVNVYGQSSDFEIDHLNIQHKNAGMWIKTELDSACNPANQFPNWVLNNFNIHDNYIHNNAAEGMYLGSTAPNGNAGTQHPSVYCHGDTTQPNLGMPPRLGSFHIWSNYLDSNGRAAIQLADADKGMSEINNNTILRCGWDPDIFQGNGISLGTYTHVYVHDNYVNYTKKDGIQAFGSLNWIQNNTVHNSGNDGMGHTSAASNIFVNSQNSSNPTSTYLPYDSTGFIVRNNNLDSNSSGYNIFVETGLGRYKLTGNIICGNTNEVKIVRAGINYASNCATPDYTLVLDSVLVTQIVPKHKTFFRDSLIFTHADSVKIVAVFFAGGKPINRINLGWQYGAFEDTSSIPVPYDSIIYKKILVDSFYYDTVWISEAARQFGFNQNSNPDYQLPAFVDTLNNLGVNVLRYPGGIRSDSSDWRTFIHPTLSILAATRNALNCDIDFVMNMNTSTLSEQIAMLDSAASLGIPIKYIEFGNEVSNAPAPLRQKFHSSGKEYGDTCKVWAAAIKAKYPQVKCAAWGENKTDIPAWQQDLLSVYIPDALVSHLYPSEYQITDTTTGIIDTALFGRIINNAFIRTGFTGSLPIWITEYNLSPNYLNILAAGEHVRGLVFMTHALQKRQEIKMLLMHSVQAAPNGALDVDVSNNVSILETGQAYKQIIKF